MSNDAPPQVIFYAETGGKTAPFYRTLGGIKSAFKTTWEARWRPDRYQRPKVYRGVVRWEEIDPETGHRIILIQDHPGNLPWGPSLEVHLTEGVDFYGHGLSQEVEVDWEEWHARDHEPGMRKDLIHSHRRSQ